MSQGKAPAIEVQKKTEPARQLEQEVTRQPAQEPVQQVAPQAAYRRAQVGRSGLRPADLLALQRAVGNRQVQRVVAQHGDHGVLLFVQRQSEPAGKPSETNLEQGLANLKHPGNKYELNLEHKGDRYSFSFRLEIARTKPTLIVGEVGPAKGTLGESKLSIKKSAGQTAAFAIAEAIANLDLEVKELAPGISVNVNLKTLEAELDLEKGEVDVNVFKVGVALKGKLTKAIEEFEWGRAILATEVGTKIKEGLNVTVTGMFELKLDPADAVRIMRSIKLQRLIYRNASEATKAKKLIDRLKDINKVLKRRLKGGGSKLSKSARDRASRRLFENSEKIVQLEKKLLQNKTATKQMTSLLRKSLEGLKTKAGRLVGKTICKAAGKTLAKLIPIVGQILTVLDFIDVIDKIYNLATGKAKFGIGGEEEGKVAGEKAEASDAEEGEATGKEAKAGGSEQVGLGAGEAGEEELGEEIDISESLKYIPASGLAEPSKGKGKESVMHPAALAIFAMIKSHGGQGVRLTPDDIAQLNDLVPRNLKGDQLSTILNALKEAKAAPAENSFHLLGAIHQLVSQVTNPEPVTTITTTSEQEEKLTGPSALPPSLREKKPMAKKPITKQDIVNFMSNAKSQMLSQGLTTYIQLHPQVQKKNVKQGTVLTGMIAYREGDSVVGGYAVITITKILPNGSKYVCHILRTDLYDEQGNFVLTVDAKTFENMLEIKP